MTNEKSFRLTIYFIVKQYVKTIENFGRNLLDFNYLNTKRDTVLVYLSNTFLISIVKKKKHFDPKIQKK